MLILVKDKEDRLVQPGRFRESDYAVAEKVSC